MSEPLLETLSRLVGFNTVSDRDVRDLAEFLADRLDALGFRIERFPHADRPGKYNLLASIGPEGTDGIVLSGHMDVVPTEGQPWSTDPFVLTERDGRLYGRGTADMKGFFAATLDALGRLDLRKLRRELVLVWTYDEEVGCLGSARLAADFAAGGRTLPSATLIGEPTDFEILRMHPGHVAVEIEVEGRAAHSSRPHLGVNAIEGAARVVRAVRQLARDLEGERPDGAPEPWVPVNVARIQGGTAVNIVPDRCVLQLGYRPPPGMPEEQVFRRIQAHVAAVAENASIEARLLRVTPSLLTPAGTALEALLAPHASRPGTGMAPFATDGGNLACLGTKPLIFGPGSIDVAHKADEFVEMGALKRASEVLEILVQRRCFGDGASDQAAPDLGVA
jgi:acetylornithine deacetylase